MRIILKQLLQHNLPYLFTSFIGRNQDIEDAISRLRDCRLVTLTGVGGCGKTRLALQVADVLLEEFPDGVWFVDLSTRSGPDVVTYAVMQILSVEVQHNVPLTETLACHIEPLRLLLILDNCEHLVEQCAHLANLLLHKCPHLHVLATSRQPLSADYETTWQVSTLSIPDLQATLPFDELSQYESVQLFEERARLKQPKFRLTPQNAWTIAQICYHLDGLPMAIELAAARMSVLTVEQIREQLKNHRFQLLETNDPIVSPRQQSLMGLLDWSYNLLSEPERLLLSILSVFPTTFDLEAVQAICDLFSANREDAKIQDTSVPGLLTKLVDESLVARSELGQSVRYYLLETIRDYASEKLKHLNLTIAVRNCHAYWYLRLAEQAEPHLTGVGQVEWVARLHSEYDNLRAAMHWAKESSNVSLGLCLAGTLGWYWMMSPFIGEGRQWLADMLSMRSKPEHNAARAKAYSAAARLALFQGDNALAQRCLEESMGLYRSLDDKSGILRTLIGQGYLAHLKEDYTSSEAVFKESLLLAKEANDSRFIAISLRGLGYITLREGNYDQAHTVLMRCLTIFRQLGDKFSVAYVLFDLGYEALGHSKRKRAAYLLKKALALFVELDATLPMARCLGLLAEITSANGQYIQAARLFAVAERMFNELDVSRRPINEASYAQSLADTRTQLGQEAWQEAWDQGQAMTLDQTIKFVLEPNPRKRVLRPPADSKESELTQNIPLSASPPYDTNVLTKRQAEVFTLIASGLSVQQVAAHLSVSHRTVEAHLQTAYKRLGIKRRT